MRAKIGRFKRFLRGHKRTFPAAAVPASSRRVKELCRTLALYRQRLWPRSSAVSENVRYLLAGQRERRGVLRPYVLHPYVYGTEAAQRQTCRKRS